MVKMESYSINYEAGDYDIEADMRNLNLAGHVGFDSLPDQFVHKITHQGFCFNILCIGETGIGKSTMMNTLFNTNFESVPQSHIMPGVKLKANTYELQESNVKLKLTIIDTVGFGDQINKENSYKPILEYINQQFENYLQEELKVHRSLPSLHDSRVHACLYFVSPTGHSLKSLDFLTMKKLDDKVNIIPIIAKADIVSKGELQKFKSRVMNEIISNGIEIYQFPTDDETIAEVNGSMNDHVPFAVVGSNEEIRLGNKLVRGRHYPWGTVQVENEDHCDFVKLREMLIRINMEDLREKTHSKHYECYRQAKLSEMGFTDDSTAGKDLNLQDIYETKRGEHSNELQRKEDEMRQMFVTRVREKESELKRLEKELHDKFEALKRMHLEEKKKLENKKRTLQEEMNEFEKRKQESDVLLMQSRDLVSQGHSKTKKK